MFYYHRPTPSRMSCNAGENTPTTGPKPASIFGLRIDPLLLYSSGTVLIQLTSHLNAEFIGYTTGGCRFLVGRS